MIKHLESLASAIFFFFFLSFSSYHGYGYSTKKNWRYLGEKQGTVNTSCKQNDRIFFYCINIIQLRHQRYNGDIKKRSIDHQI